MRVSEQVEALPRAAWLLGAVGVMLVAASLLLVALAPLAASIGTVLVFAVPHNWMEARVFLVRLPPRWGPLRRSLLVGLLGALALAATLPVLASLPWLSGPGAASRLSGVATWLSMLWLWIALVIDLRGRERRRDRGWAWPVALALVAGSWMWPAQGLLLLVYLHPVMALVFLWRATRRRRPEWLAGLRVALAAVPLSVVALWLLLARSTDLDVGGPVGWRVVEHAGASVLPGVSSHFLVATHVHLEVLHYAAWLVAIPAVMLRGPAWRLTDVPLAQRSRRWNVTIGVALASLALVACVAWGAFAVDYATTRDVYFTLATLHVLAEVPFLVRLT